LGLGMSRRISKKRAEMLYNKELENRELQRKGISVKSNRKEKKYERFIERLRFRGGLFIPKEEAIS